jgi:hypothetical protein
MKRILLGVAFLLGFVGAAQAQCVGAGSISINNLPGITCASEPVVTSYAAMGYGIAPASSATDIACITGSATKTIRVQSVRVSGTAGTLITLPVLLNFHTIANTGGTAAATTALPAPVPLDTKNAAVSATTTAYTANPTVDGSAVQIDAQTVSFNVTSALVNPSFAFFDYRERNFMQAPVLRGIAQQLCVNLGGISVSSGLLAVSFAWTEQAQ